MFSVSHSTVCLETPQGWRDLTPVVMPVCLGLALHMQYTLHKPSLRTHSQDGTLNLNPRFNIWPARSQTNNTDENESGLYLELDGTSTNPAISAHPLLSCSHQAPWANTCAVQAGRGNSAPWGRSFQTATEEFIHTYPNKTLKKLLLQLSYATRKAFFFKLMTFYYPETVSLRQQQSNVSTSGSLLSLPKKHSAHYQHWSHLFKTVTH